MEAGIVDGDTHTQHGGGTWCECDTDNCNSGWDCTNGGAASPGGSPTAAPGPAADEGGSDVGMIIGIVVGVLVVGGGVAFFMMKKKG